MTKEIYNYLGGFGSGQEKLQFPWRFFVEPPRKVR